MLESQAASVSAAAATAAASATSGAAAMPPGAAMLPRAEASGGLSGKRRSSAGGAVGAPGLWQERIDGGVSLDADAEAEGGADAAASPAEAARLRVRRLLAAGGLLRVQHAELDGRRSARAGWHAAAEETIETLRWTITRQTTVVA
jgi:hypothetical protein